jgi:esterase/lipase superfamily enzyme
VVLFTWPAGAGGGLLDSTLITRTYEANKLNAEATIPLAADFFKQLATLDSPVQLMVHSMGHQVVIPALAETAAQVKKPFIGELILNAPDIPVEDFTRLAPAARGLTRRTTVYCSFNDNAISASETYNKNRRMGACEAVEGVDVINVSEIDAPALGIGGLGHGYYASRPILTDISQLLQGTPAEFRVFVRKSEPNSVENFYLRP